VSIATGDGMTPNHLSFGAQAMRYFAVNAIIMGLQVGAGQITLAVAGGVTLAARGITPPIKTLGQGSPAARGIGLDALTRDDFPLPTLAAAIPAWRAELSGGRGFLLVRGLPVARWGDERSALVYWGLGQHLGAPGAQNPEGELLGHVVDTGEDAANPFVRRYRTAGDIAFHCDLADVVGLLCLRAARRGGASRIVSSVSVYNALLRERPDLIDRLYEPFCLDTRDEQVDLTAKRVARCRYARRDVSVPGTGSSACSGAPCPCRVHRARSDIAGSVRSDCGLAGPVSRYAVRARRHSAHIEPQHPPRADRV
jgi:hypothetical protein